MEVTSAAALENSEDFYVFGFFVLLGPCVEMSKDKQT
jgi:hypothetical protein